MVRFECSLPNEEDARLVFQWRNDPTTRAMSFNTDPKTWEAFQQEYNTRMFSVPELPPLFIVNEGERAGHIFFDRGDEPEINSCVISINLAPEARGKGLGVQALRAIQPWVARQGFDAILAEIKTENAVSHKAFLAAGYKKIRDEKNYSVYAMFFRAQEAVPSIFVIAEAGSNWHVGQDNGKNHRQALKLIEAAADAGADAVKFQVFRAKTTYAPNAGKADYLDGSDDIGKLFEQLAMSYDKIPELADYCSKCGIEFMASAFSLEDLRAVDPYVKRHKIASYEITYSDLIEAVAKIGKPTFISTGAATADEISWAVDLYRKSGGRSLTLMQCTAHYPAPDDAMNLRVLSWLRQRFQVSVGLSDHSRDPLAAPAAAAALGATAIEKHFTLDRSLPGPDHSFAIIPDELKELVRLVRTETLMLGSGAKTIHPSETELRQFAQRRLQATCPVKKGETLQVGVNMAILRPGKQPSGVHPKFLSQFEGKPAEKDYQAGEGIQ